MKLPYSTIRTAWEYFSSCIISRNVSRSSMQYDQMRKTFYAGASCCFAIVQTAGENESEDDGVKRLAAIHQEFEEFAKSLMS